MGSYFTFRWVEEFIADRFPDPEPWLECVRAYRAVDCLLFSAAVLGTVEPHKLQAFTGYHPAFIAAVAWNMRNSRLWTANGYDSSQWLSSSGEMNNEAFLEDVGVAFGDVWCPDAEFPEDVIDVYQAFGR